MRNAAVLLIDKNKQTEGDIKKEIKGMLLYIVFLVCFLFFIYAFVGQQVEVNGTSMESTLQNKDHLILEKLSYRFSDPKRFDIVVFRPNADQKSLYYIKRIIGLPGETVQIIDHDIWINHNRLEENYGKEEILIPGIAKTPIVLGDEEYFVLGDNRNNSRDSRVEEVGTIEKEAILGRAFMRIWPINELGVLKHR